MVCLLQHSFADQLIRLDVIVEWDESDTKLMGPLQHLLDQCRVAKQVSK